jgi:hypothetical protein
MGVFTATQREALRDMPGSRLAGVIAVALLLLAGLFLMVARLLGRSGAAVRRLAAVWSRSATGWRR